MATQDFGPLRITSRDQGAARLLLEGEATGPARLAAERLRRVAEAELGITLEVHSGRASPQDSVLAFCRPWSEAALAALREAGMEIGGDGRLQALTAAEPRRAQGFVAGRVPGLNGDRLLLAADTEIGLRNALLTLADRLYRDSAGHVVADPFDGVHVPAFDARHLKTDAMNCGPFRSRLEYWDPTTAAGVNEFADWLASFRITDYDLLAFVRGWGLSYPSERFPGLVDPQHPNSTLDFYPRLMDRLHEWGLRVWAADLYLASGYTMEVGTVPEMRSPCADAVRVRPFQAGEGPFYEILGDAAAVVCLAHPQAGRFYAGVVDDLLTHYPTLDGLDFHIGHTFSDARNKICRCPQCQDLRGNQEGVYRCFAQAYAAGVARKPDVRMRTAVKMFGDATRRIVEHWEEFPNLEFFCWLRWIGSLVIERVDAVVTTGHEDGGGGLEANHDPRKTITQIRDYFRDFESVIQTYVYITRHAGLASISWEPALQRELEPVYFCYSQMTWEPQLRWGELARRYVLRSERRLDDPLISAYRLALEANADLTHWGAITWGPGAAEAPRQALLQCDPRTGILTDTTRVLEREGVRARIVALGEMLQSLGVAEANYEVPPAVSDLRWTLAKAWKRMQAGQPICVG